jgi:prepilin-type N-terminal cleavage/methylation domain-containing protein
MHIIRPRRPHPVWRDAAGRTGFTLVEVMVATTLAGLVLAGILSSFLMIGRSGANAANYIEMEREARKGLEQFGQDVRMALYLKTISSTHVQLTIPHHNDNGSDVIDYIYDPVARTFSRHGPDPITETSRDWVLIRDVERCEFKRWMLGLAGPAAGDASTDQLQIRISLRKSSVTAVAATNLVISARFVLRNHRSFTTA